MIVPSHPEHRGHEREFVRRLAGQLQISSPLGLPFGDDMAGVPGQPRLAWTTDVLLDGVHFQSDRHAWAAIGRKAMAVNLSDCAAMAARPIGALCAVTAAPGMSMQDLIDLEAAMHKMGMTHDCPILGGNTSSWNNPAVIAVTVLAELPDGPPLLRSNARSGDSIWVSGPLGGSILGRHLWFEPRVCEAQNIHRRLPVTAMMDISDGLAIDLSRIMEASGCGALLDRDLLERAIHPDARQLAIQDLRTPLEHALYDGEDFELLIALAPEASADIAHSLGLLKLGHLTPNAGELLLQDGQRVSSVPVRGWEHLK